MENPEEILHSLEEFSKMKPKDIPRELEEYLCFVAKTGNPVYQWQTIKSLFREKLLSVITEFYESCPSVEIPPCPNVEMFNYDLMKNFILEKLDTFASAPFTVQRICELLTTPRKEYNRIDKYMRALEKNILVVSTTEPGRISTENGESIMNGIEPEHLPESSNSSHDINVEEMDESPSWPRTAQMAPILFETCNNENQSATINEAEQETFPSNNEAKVEDIPSSGTTTITEPQRENPQETIITCSSADDTQQPYVSIAPVALNACTASQEVISENQAETCLSITALPAGLQQRRNSTERGTTSENREAEVQDVKKITFIEDEQKTTSEEEEQAQPSADTTLTSPTCPETADNITIVEVDKHPEEIPLVKEQCNIDDISSENSSPTVIDISLPTLQLDIGRQKYESETEGIEKLEEKNQDESKTPQNEASSKEEKCSELKEEPEQITCVLTSTCPDESEVEPVSESSNDSQPTSEPLREAVAKLEVSTEQISADLTECDEKKTEEDSVVGETDCKSETPMDVEVSVPDEIKSDEKEEQLVEEPSSTSNAL